MAPYARTDVIITDAHQADGVGGISRQTVGTDTLGQLVATDEFEGHRQVFVNQPQHLALNLLLFLPCGLVVKMEAHLALLTLDVGIERTLTAKETDHDLVEQVLSRMGRGKLLLVVFVQYVVSCHNLCSI